jgi:arabinoxylan arabinofuranohydrolase
MCKKIFATAAIVAASLQANAQTLATEYKSTSNGNPISAAVFCADPTAIDYNGRLYVYGTNDHQQYIVNKKTGSNGYGNIKSLVVFSTDDMVNWTFHGTIDVGKVCSWAGQSWAPSAVWRTTSAGKDEFFVYFANGGGSVGVMKSTKSPVGPFTSPNSQPMIRHGMAGVDPCNWLFDPGAVIDSTGQGWIGFGGGDPQSSGSKLWPGNSRIAKLSSSMTSISGSAKNMPAPYLFEASELNIIGGRFVYTYNTSWSDRNDWTKFEGRNGQPAPSSCSMCYMVSDNPLDPNSWEYRGEYVPNEGNFGMGWGNNHTHLHKFQGKYYLFYHSTVLESAMKDGKAMDGGASGYRSIGVNVATVNESKQTINKMTLNKTGVTAIRNLDPYQLQEAETMATCGGFTYEDFSNITKNTGISSLGNDASRALQLKLKAGAWTQLRKVDFGTEGAGSFMLRAKGTGTVEIRLGTKTAKPAASLDFTSTAYQDFNIPVDPAVFKGVKTVFLVCTAATTAYIDAWQFMHDVPDAISTVRVSPQPAAAATYDLTGQRANTRTARRGVYIQNGKKVVVK